MQRLLGAEKYIFNCPVYLNGHHVNYINVALYLRFLYQNLG